MKSPQGSDPMAKPPVKVKPITMPDTDDEMENGKMSAKKGPLNKYIKSAREQHLEWIAFILEHTCGYLECMRPIGVKVSVAKVIELRKKMDEASANEDFLGAISFKDEYKGYYSASQKEMLWELMR
jgi:hypothetical protein